MVKRRWGADAAPDQAIKENARDAIEPRKSPQSFPLPPHGQQSASAFGSLVDKKTHEYS